eukprot:jgi/Tetstr1/463291/TSEL_008215.t1
MAQDPQREAVGELVWKLADDFHGVLNTPRISARLHETMVTVLMRQQSQSVKSGAAQQALASLASGAANPQQLRSTYQSLSDKGVGGLDQLLLLLAKVSEDDNIKNALSHAPQPMSPPPPTPSRLASGRTPAPRPTTAAKPAARPAPTPLPPTNDGGGGSPSPSQSAAAPPAGTTPSVSRSLAPLLATPPMAQHEGESPIPSSVSFISKNPVFDDAEGEPASVGGGAAPVALLSTAYKRQPVAAAAQAGNVGDLFLEPGKRSGLEGGEGGSSGPPQPRWNHARPFLTGADIMRAAPPKRGGPDLQQYSPSVQEICVIDDLLYAMLGMDGSFVHLRRLAGEDGQPQVAFEVDASLEPALQEMVERLLPICEYVAIIQRFVETRSGYEQGMVCQATAAAMRSLLHDWHLMVAQLEHQFRTGYLSVQALWFYCQEPQASLALLAAIAAEAASKRLRGPELLNLLHARANSMAGSGQARSLMLKLLCAGAEPYMRMLERWLCEGRLDDPFGEFMVQCNEDMTKESLTEDAMARFWVERYSLCGPVPTFLEELKMDILTTGKYLNAIRECDRPVGRPLPAGTHLVYDAGQSYQAHIRSCFDYAAAALLKLVTEELGLMALLRSLKHYFLLDQGDFLLGFLDTAEDELSKKASEISITRLQSLLEMGLRTSIASNDPHAEDLGCTLDHRSMTSMLKHIFASQGRPRGTAGGVTPAAAARTPASALGRLALESPMPSELGSPMAATPMAGGKAKAELMTGLQSFVLTFKVRWPMSLVVSARSLLKYRVIFRHLFDFKCLERCLTGGWRDLQVLRHAGDAGVALRPAHWLCQQMTHFVQAYCTFTTTEVLEQRWHGMDAAIRGAKTIDEVVALHDRFLDAAMKGCLLVDIKVLKQMDLLKGLCRQFIEVIQPMCVEVSDEEVADAVAAGVAGGAGLPKGARLHRVRQQLLQQKVDAQAGGAGSLLHLQSSFTASLTELLLALRDRSHQPHKQFLEHLVTRMDFNHFLIPEE